MEEKYYYAVTLKEDKVVGFNLNEKELNKVYRKNLKKQIFCAYGALSFKVKKADDIINMKTIKNEFRNNNGLYSYIVISTEKKWLASGFNESLEGLYATIQEIEELNPNLKYTIFEITGKHLEFE